MAPGTLRTYQWPRSRTGHLTRSRRLLHLLLHVRVHMRMRLWLHLWPNLCVGCHRGPEERKHNACPNGALMLTHVREKRMLRLKRHQGSCRAKLVWDVRISCALLTAKTEVKGELAGVHSRNCGGQSLVQWKSSRLKASSRLTQTHLASCAVRPEAVPAGCVPFNPMCKRDEFFRRGVV